MRAVFSTMLLMAHAVLAAAPCEKVLFDTDIGGDPDDGLALTYLLKEPQCELLGVTTCYGLRLRAWALRRAGFRRPVNLFFHDPIAAVAIFHPEIMTYAPSAVRVAVDDRAKTCRTAVGGDSTWIWQTATAVDFGEFQRIFLSTVKGADR